MKMYTFYDKKAVFHMTPLFLNDDNDAKRVACDVMRSGDSILSNYPEDYALYFVGDYNPSTAEVNNIIPPVLVAEMSQFKVVKINAENSQQV